MAEIKVDFKHAQYEASSAKWGKCRDAIAGEEAIKAAGTTYLPKLDDQKDGEYRAYLQRALYYNASGRTLIGLSGCIFRLDSEKDIPAAMDEMAQNVDLMGAPLDVFARRVVEDVIAVGRSGVLIDYSVERRQAYFCQYAAEAIINWRVSYVNDVPLLTKVVLYETVEQVAADGFGVSLIPQWRELSLDEGFYVVRLWRKKRDDKGVEVFYVFATLRPQMRGSALPFIPFVFFSPWDLDSDVETPPLLDLVNTNLSHFRSSADLEHGRHYTALPTPWISGVPDNMRDSLSLRIGSSTAWLVPGDGSCGMLEFSGAGLTYLENAIKDKEQKMAVLGARLLEEQKRDAEAAATVKLRHAGESSVLSAIARTCSEGVVKAMEIARDWMGLAGEVKYELNKRFFDEPVDANMLQQVVSAWQAGALSRETMWGIMQRGAIVPLDRTVEEEIEQISLEGPAPGAIEDSTDPGAGGGGGGA